MTYVHDIDPFAIELNWRIFGFHLDGIRWYGLAYLSAFLAGYATVAYLSKRQTSPVPYEKCSDLTTYIALGVLMGGRIGYVVFYQPQLLWSFSSSFPFWEAMDPTGGGMASHGGMMGAGVACWLFARKYKLPILHLLDLCCLGGALGFLFGRIANFINGELYGRQAPEGYSWAVKFPSEMYRWVRDAQEASGDYQQVAVERLRSLGPVVEKLSPMKTSNGSNLSINAAEWATWIDRLLQKGQSYVEGRMYRFFEYVIEATQSGNKTVIEAIEPVLTPRYPSQLYQCFMEGFLVLVLMFVIWLRPRKPGVLAGWFGMSYALMRILGEQYRMPDVHLGYQWLGLTRGQWLSFALFAVGLALLLFSMRLNNAKAGGWFINNSKKS